MKGGLTGEPIDAVETIILFMKNPDDSLTEIGRTSTIASDGSWEITDLDPLDFLTNEDQTSVILVAQAIQHEGDPENEEFVNSAEFTLEIDCPLPTPTITEPSSVTNCDTTFDVKGGLTGEPIDAVETIILFMKNPDDSLTEIGRTSTIASDGSWEITDLDPLDFLTNEDQTSVILVAQAIQHEGDPENEEFVNSAEFTLEIDCPLPTPTITEPSSVTNCDTTFDVKGGLTGEPIDAVETIILFMKNPDDSLTEIGRTSTIASDGSWEITDLDPLDFLTNEDQTSVILVAQAIQHEGDPENEEFVNSAEFTLEIDCPVTPTTIEEPSVGTTIECEQPLTLTGTFDMYLFQ